MAIKKLKTKDGWDIITIERQGYKEHIISVDIGNGITSTKDIAGKIRVLGMEVLGQFILAGCEQYEPVRKAMGHIDWPLTWIQGDACSGGELHSSQIIAVSGISTKPVILGNEVVGRLYEDDHAIYCRIAGIIPGDISATPEKQALSVFEQMEEALVSAGLQFTDVVRTWLYLDDLLQWYGAFNKVRTAFFTRHEVFDHLVPASTGIGACNPYHAALMADALVVKPKNSSCKVQAVASPLQCPAVSYKSSFSRAVEISYPDLRHLLISGTASIGTDGRTIHTGNPANQVEQTMKVAEAILVSRDMGWEDITRAIAYFKDMSSLNLYEKYCRENSIPSFPRAVSHADICRDDLLFEIEVDAVKFNE